jgi:uncharacterized protein YndB with AHSA1/START domain
MIATKKTIDRTSTSVKPSSTRAMSRTAKKFVVKKTIRLHATPEAVWDALTNPAKTRRYFFNCEVHSDWKVGSRISWKGRIFLVKKIEFHGKIVQILPKRLLKYTLENQDRKGQSPTISTVTDELSFSKGVTTLSVTDDVGQTQGAEERYIRSNKGWDKVLDGLKSIVEEK